MTAERIQSSWKNFVSSEDLIVVPNSQQLSLLASHRHRSPAPGIKVDQPCNPQTGSLDRR